MSMLRDADRAGLDTINAGRELTTRLPPIMVFEFDIR
jgi:hypothetical protein